MSSSSAESDASLRRLVNLCVEHADGSIEVIADGGLRIQGGANISFNTDFDDEEILLEINSEAGREDPYYRQKYNALANMSLGQSSSGESLDPKRDAWLFTDSSVFISKINNAIPEPNSGAIFVVGDTCTTAGEFDSTWGSGYPQDPKMILGEGSSSSELCGGELVYTDICSPCLDCPQYYKMEEYLARIASFYDYIFNLSYASSTALSSIPNHPDGEVKEAFAGVLQQYMATRKFWDYLVHNSSVKLSAQAYGQSVVVAGFYRNISDQTIGDGLDGVTLTYLLSFKKVDSGGNITDWSGIASSVTDVVPLVRQERCAASLGGSGISYPSGNQIQIQMISGSDLASGAEIYGDVAIVMLGTILSNDPAYSYRVDVDMTVSHTHLGPIGSDNPVQRDTIVYFRPPDPESSA